jgi:hypothetical protein
VPEVNKVNLLKTKGDFLMHGVVLHFSCFPAPRAVKHRAVSRETIFSSAAHPESALQCFT